MLAGKMNADETLTHPLINRTSSHVCSGVNTVSPPTLRIRDSMSVGKCGDADCPETDYADCEFSCTDEQCWHSSIQNSTGNPSYTSHGYLDPLAKPDDILVRRNSSIYSKSPDLVYPNEPPKLRRGMAYLDFEDGDCEPDDCFQACVSHHSMARDKGHLLIDRNYHQTTESWRSRVCQAWKNSALNRFVKREPRQKETFECNNEDPVSHGAANSAKSEHLPSGDLFHQFKSTF